MPELVISPLLNMKDRRVERHHVPVLPRKRCSVCDGEVAVAKDIWLRIRGGDEFVFVCERCSFVGESH